ADLFAAGTAVFQRHCYQRHVVCQQPQHGDLYGDVAAGDALAAGAFLAHATTPGPSTPGCSKNTCTSSQRMWYIVTCTSLTTRGSLDAATSRWSTAMLVASRLPSPPARAIVSRPSSLAARSPASTLGLFPSGEIPSAMSSVLARARSWCAKIASTPSRSAIPVTVATSVVSAMAGSARLPTITGWTNSTATCCASALAPPVPNTTSLPPRWNRIAIAWQAAATASAWVARWRAGSSRRSNTGPGSGCAGCSAYVSDSSVSSSPPVISTLTLPQPGHAGTRSVLSPAAPQSRKVTVAGTVTTVTTASAAAVPAASMANACTIDGGSTACRTPHRTRIPATGRPAARTSTASSTPSHSPYSCMRLSYICLIFRYRLMSGSEATTMASGAATIAAITIFFSICAPSFCQDLLHRANGVRQSGRHLSRQPDARGHVGRLARHHDAAPGAPAHRGEHREDLIRRQAVRVHHRGSRSAVGRVHLEHGHRARRLPARRGVDQHEQVAPVEQFVHQVHAADAEILDHDAGLAGPVREQPRHLDAEPVVVQEHVAHPGHEGAAGHGSTSSGAKYRSRPCAVRRSRSGSSASDTAR